MNYPDLKLLLDAATTTETISSAISILKDEYNRPYPDIKKLKKEYNPETHDVMDESLRKKKTVYGPPKEKPRVLMPGARPGDPLPPAETSQNIVRVEEVTRISLPFQRKIVESRVNMAFGIPVQLHCDTQDDIKKEQLLDLVNKIRDKNKIDTIDREYAREAQRATRVALNWFFVDGDRHNDYGVPMLGKFRCAVWKPWEGNELFPYFDDFNDMIAFSRGYKYKNIKNEDVNNFECYTSEFKYHFVADSNTGWRLNAKVANTYGKIPVVYTEFPEAAWEEVRQSIKRAEKILSDHGDINSYNAAPILFAQGGLVDMFEKDDTGRILVGGKDSELKVISWDNAPESIKLEIELRFREIYGFTNTPDLSMEQMSKLTNPSGETMKMLLVAATLQVLSDSEKYTDMQERSINLLLAMISTLVPAMKETAQSIIIKPKIIPFTIDNLVEKIGYLSQAVSAGIIAEKTATILSGLVENADKEVDQINAEKDATDERTNKNFQLQNTVPDGE